MNRNFEILDEIMSLWTLKHTVDQTARLKLNGRTIWLDNKSTRGNNCKVDRIIIIMEINWNIYYSIIDSVAVRENYVLRLIIYKVLHIFIIG